MFHPCLTTHQTALRHSQQQHQSLQPLTPQHSVWQRHPVNRRLRGGCSSTATCAAAATTSNNHCKLRKMLPVQPLRSDEVWYLGYGSNMSPQTLTGRRRVRPQQSLPCYVPGYSLSFGVQGFPWAEPGFATICELDTAPAAAATQHDGGDDLSSWRQHTLTDGTPCLHAVLHRVTQQEWASIKASEGVFGSGQSSSVGYQVVEVDCVLYDNQTVIKALTLQAAEASLHSPTRPVSPSARYLRLLQEGSRHHDLDRHYQQWLLRLQPYQPPSTLVAAVGASISSAVLLSAASSAVPAYFLSRAFGSGSTSSSTDRTQSTPETGEAGHGSSSSSKGETAAAAKAFLPFLRQYTSRSQSLMWDVHDRLELLLGSGSSAPNKRT